MAIARSQRVSFDARGHVSARSWAPQHQGLILLPEQLGAAFSPALNLLVSSPPRLFSPLGLSSAISQ